MTINNIFIFQDQQENASRRVERILVEIVSLILFENDTKESERLECCRKTSSVRILDHLGSKSIVFFTNVKKRPVKRYYKKMGYSCYLA